MRNTHRAPHCVIAWMHPQYALHAAHPGVSNATDGTEIRAVHRTLQPAEAVDICQIGLCTVSAPKRLLNWEVHKFMVLNLPPFLVQTCQAGLPIYSENFSPIAQKLWCVEQFSCTQSAAILPPKQSGVKRCTYHTVGALSV